MAIYHLHIDSYRRSRGRTAIGGFSYRRGLKAACPVSGKSFDFRKKGEVVYSELLPAKNDRTDYGRLANLVKLYETIERSEKHPRATLGREIEAALPHELKLPQQIVLVREFIAELRRSVNADKAFFDYSIHAKSGNVHVHIAMCEREQVAPFVFMKTKRRDWDGEAFVSICREAWQRQTNAALQKAGINQRVDSRSHAERGLAILPLLHEGKATYFHSEVKKMNDIIMKANLKVQAGTDEREARKERVNQVLRPTPKPVQVQHEMTCADPVIAEPYKEILAERHYRDLFTDMGLSFVNLRDRRRAVLLFKDKSKIYDSGSRAVCVNSTPEHSAERLVMLALERCWGAVSFNGDEAFLRLAFILAIEHGLTVIPKDAGQQNILDSLRGVAVPALVEPPPVVPKTPGPALRPISLDGLATRIDRRRENENPAPKGKRRLTR